MEAVVENVVTKRRTMIALKRLKPSANGYRLYAASNGYRLAAASPAPQGEKT